jgi:uncharacterized heparinase superfamily protein
MPMILEDIIGEQPPTVSHEGLEWAISTKLDELRMELEEIKMDDGGHFRREHACEIQILFLEMELARIQENLRILLDN